MNTAKYPVLFVTIASMDTDTAGSAAVSVAVAQTVVDYPSREKAMAAFRSIKAASVSTKRATGNVSAFCLFGTTEEELKPRSRSKK